MDNSLYTPQVRNFIRTRDWPSGLIYEVAESPTHLTIVFFRDNWITLPMDSHWKIISIVREINEKLGRDGIPISVGKMERAVPLSGG